MKPASNKQLPRIIITADLHGSYAAWQYFKEILQPSDLFIIAGDLFGTRYPEYNNPDYRPEDIRAELTGLPCPFIYIYGNCDIPTFCPGYNYEKTFSALGKTWFVCHGDTPFASDADIIVTGHTHVAEIRKEGSVWFLNPGSPTKPRDGKPSYLIYTDRPHLAHYP